MWIWFVGMFILFFHIFLTQSRKEIKSIALAVPPSFLLVLPFYRFNLEDYLADARFFVDLCLQNLNWVALGVFLLSIEFAIMWISSSKMEREVYRHFGHLTGILLVAYFLAINEDLAYMVLCFYIACFCLGTYFRYAPFASPEFKTFQRWVNQWLGAAERTKAEKKLFMAAYFAMSGMLACLLLLGREIALASTLVLATGDPSAALFGMKFGKHKWKHNPRKTLEGSLVMSLVVFGVLSLFISPLKSLVIAVSIAVFESLPLEMSDNLLVPVLTGMLLKTFA